MVHGDIRHLENKKGTGKVNCARSWRHTPFRKQWPSIWMLKICSWRHTPFRKFTGAWQRNMERSWRHTPFRNDL